MDLTRANTVPSRPAVPRETPVRAPWAAWTRWLGMLLVAVVLVACDSVEERAEGHYQNGLSLLEGGDPVKATLEFRNAVKLNENHIGANYELGKIYEENRDLAAAVQQFQRVVGLDGTHFDAHLRLGQLFMTADQVEPAAVSIATAAQLRPDDIEVLILEATLAMRTNNFELSEAKAEAALNIDANEGDAWTVLAALSRRRGEPDRSIEQIEEGLRRDPDNIRALLFRLNLLSELEREADLGPALKRLVEVQPEEISFYDALVRWQLRNGEYAGAEETLRQISELAPDDNARALDIVRLIAQTEGRPAAIRELGKLIEQRKGTGVERMLNLAMAEIETEDRQLDAATERLTGIIDAKGDDEIATSARNLLARIKLNQDEALSAQALIDAVLAGDPTNSTALTLRGRIKVLDEDYDAAIRDLRAAEAEDPDNVEILQLLALAHQRNGSNDLAGERLAAAVEASNYGEVEVMTYAQFLLRQGKNDFAEDLVGDALARQPGNIRLVDSLARIKLHNRDYTGVEEIARALQQEADTAELGDRLLAAALAGQERYDETISILEQAGAEEGRANAYLSALVATHLRNNDMEAADALVETALEEDAANADALRLKATLAMVRGEQDAAGEIFQQAVATRPQNPANHMALYRFYAQTGQADAAVAALEAGIEATASPALHLNRAMVRESRGDIDGAIQDYELVYERQPGSELIANNLASLITDNDPTPEQIERAFTIAKRLRDTEVPQFKDTYGWLLYLRGDIEAARAKLEEAAEDLGDNPIVLYHLGVVLAELGERDRAVTLLREAIELSGGREIPQIADVQARLDSLTSIVPQ